MARIRTVKPEFFRHESLQELEIRYPGKYPLVVFAGLWCHSDKNGVFEWKPRTLKLDILPFLNFDMEDTLNVLIEAKQIIKFEIEGKIYGITPTFKKHQRIGGKEAQDDARFPLPDNYLEILKQWGSNGEATGKQRGLQEGKGKEGKGKDIQFEIFWKDFPARNGKKLLQQEAKDFFTKNIKDEEFSLLQQAVRNYKVSKSVTEGYVKDAIRFLRKDYWREWLEPETQAGHQTDATTAYERTMACCKKHGFKAESIEKIQEDIRERVKKVLSLMGGVTEFGRLDEQDGKFQFFRKWKETR